MEYPSSWMVVSDKMFVWEVEAITFWGRVENGCLSRLFDTEKVKEISNYYGYNRLSANTFWLLNYASCKNRFDLDHRFILDTPYGKLDYDGEEEPV